MTSGSNCAQDLTAQSRAHSAAFVNNAAYTNHRILQIGWIGARYQVNAKLEVAGAYYLYSQNSYASGPDSGCSGTISNGCSGALRVLSLVGDVHFTKRFDVYAGVMSSSVHDGYASGYLATSNYDPTVGLRYTF